MDYYGFGRRVEGESFAFPAPQTYSRGDIAALQALYGANFETNSQDTVYKVYADGSMTVKNGNDAIITLSDGTGPLYRTLWDGNGIDTYDFSSLTQNQRIDLRPGEGSAILPDDQLILSYTRMSMNIYNAFQYNGDPRSLIENVWAGSGDDVITGNAANNTIYGGAGNDTIYGGGGDDFLSGGGGNDIIYAGEGRYEYLNGDDGDDIIYGGAGTNYIYGGNGNDYLDSSSGWGIFQPGAGADIIIGGNTNNNDRVEYSYSREAVHVSLLDGRGYSGDAKGDTYVSIEDVSGSRYNDILIGNNDRNWLYGKDGDDTLSGEGGDDILIGENGNDTIYGGTGNDSLDGSYGDDHLEGGDGNDTVIGGDGNDSLNGGAGNDYLYGNLYGISGNDTFIFDANFGHDVIWDFTAGVGIGDVIDFSTDLFSDFQSVISAAQQVGSDTVIQYDQDNTITLHNVQLSSLSQDDFSFH